MAQGEVSSRLRALIDAGIAVSSELSLDAVLERIVEAAAEITGAPSAALMVLEDGAGEPPPGKGALVVPVHLRGVTYGNLCVAEKPGGFSTEDEELVTLLAAQAAVAVENAHLYESATRWSQQLESLNEIGLALTGELELDRLLDLVASSLRELVHARLVLIALPSGRDRIRVEAAAGEGSGDLVGWSFARTGSKGGRVLDRGRTARVDDLLDDPEVDHESTSRFGARTGLFVPLLVRDRAIGVLAVHDRLGEDGRFSSDDERIAEQFAARAAIAVDLSERVARDSLRRVVGGQELERQRLARELHDETGQALTSILLGLKTVEEAKDGEALAAASAHLRELVVSTLQDVRRLAVELRPKALDDFGLVPAVERLVETFSEHTGIEVQLESRLGEERLGDEVETTLYRLVQEALTNVVKHAHARTVSILLVRREGRVTALIEDDGRGFDAAHGRADALGLVGMRERARLVGGNLTVESSDGAGTTIAIEVPAR